MKKVIILVMVVTWVSIMFLLIAHVKRKSAEEKRQHDYQLDVLHDTVTLFDENGKQIVVCDFDSIQIEIDKDNL